MLGSTFDTVTRQASACLSRRTSLLTLGAAGLAALTGHREKSSCGCQIANERGSLRGVNRL